ncbi:DNA cytosine methyltransferase [Serratia marcescens]|uniref:DNA cytosine methyltransferase n=1 Tax=Serratia marcescens TaxID=615 RepID=UPI0027E3B686|nr:DNA cytosine methyltransferase [Serratia marcescens]HEJ7174025.1 DNA cytosine methyltransferase [Serratia marcescens]
MNCIELFAGAGGLAFGLEMSGLKTILANEIHPDPCKTLNRNFPKVPIICEDIRGLSGSQLLSHAGIEKGTDINVIAGGPPCQGFSNAGLKDPDDPRNTLIGEYLRVVKELQPDFFILENVVGLTTLHEGKLFKRVLESLDSLNYRFHWKILYAADFGVPQMRKRLIIIGSKGKSLPNFPEPLYFDLKSVGDVNNKQRNYINCGDALGDLPLIGSGEKTDRYDRAPYTEFQLLMREGSNILFNHEASKHKTETIAYYSLVPPGGTWLNIPVEHRKKKQGMQRWPLDGLSRTITTEPTDFLHPTLDRIPTIRELARIQTFPDKYEFLGQRTTGNKMRRLGYCSQSQQVGNAVPPLLAKAIGDALIKSV